MRNCFCFILLLLCTALTSFSQEKELFRVVCWNIENLFDTKSDSLKQDDDYLPSSLRAWHFGRYKKKMADVARVIAAAGEWGAPALVGLCEVENDEVLRYLTRYSPLQAYNYRYVMTSSPDVRGIDVALLYQRDMFKLLSANSLRPDLGVGERPTRDILHVTGLVLSLDTLDVFVVHSPSRYGGQRASEPRRLRVAHCLRSAVDSLIRMRQEARIIIMGDFNDYPENKSIAHVLNAQLPDTSFNETALYHLLARKVQAKGKSIPGTYKYKGEWGLLDHLIVSGKLLDATSRFYTNESNAEIISFPFLLVDDDKYGGLQPFRTYNGMKYQGGYSDHLPVRVDFIMCVD